MIELTAPLVYKNNERRIVYGPVLVPGEPDHDGDVVKSEKIEAVAHDFVEKYGNVDLQHSLNNVGKMIESYIAPVDLAFGDITVPKGSWMMGVRVTDDNAWNAVKAGKLTGFSIMGIQSSVMKSKENHEEILTALKRTTLADLGEDWIVNAVSLVDEPCVPKAKFVVIKSKNEPTGKEPVGFFGKLIQSFKSKPDAPISKEGGEDMTQDEIKDFIQSSVKSAITEALEDLTQKQAESTPEPEPTTEDNNQSDDQVIIPKEDYDALIDRVNNLEQAVEKANNFGLNFGSKKLKGQDGDSNSQDSVQKQKPTRDIFGRRI